MNSELNGLRIKLIGDIKSTITSDVYKEARLVLREAINDTLYSSHEGTTYVRTGEFLNAVRVNIISMSDSEAELRVWVDGRKLTPIYNEGSWNSHMDVKNNPFNNDGIVEVIDQGIPSRIYRNRVAMNFYREAEQNMESRLVKALAIGLTARGWQVVY